MPRIVSLEEIQRRRRALHGDERLLGWGIPVSEITEARVIAEGELQRLEQAAAVGDDEARKTLIEHDYCPHAIVMGFITGGTHFPTAHTS